jgi:Glycosyl transferase family 2
MRVALLNAFPNLPHSAEREFIERCMAVLQASEHEACRVVTSDDIIAFDPDLVIVTHEFVAKTTDHYTVGLLWSPTQFYRDDEERLKAIRSWDLVVPINAATRRFARDLHFPLRHESAVSDLDFFPSAPVADVPLPDASRLSVAYVGAHWDGQRHGELLRALAGQVELHVYGPEDAWRSMPGAYRGPIPFDGHSLVPTLNRHGIVLALHKPEHVQEATPSMRVFEGLAARCAVITEPLAPLQARFGDSLLTVEAAASPSRVARDIAAHVGRLRASAATFEALVGQSHRIFRDQVCLERLLEQLLADVAARQAAALAERERRQARGGPVVSIVIRCGSRPLAVLQRAVDSLAAQTHRDIVLLLVRFAPVVGLDDWLPGLRAGGRFRDVRVIDVVSDGLRSTAWWAGLRAVDTELFGMLDDDDELFHDHLANLVRLLEDDAGCDVAFAGGVQQEEDGVYLNTHGRFRGALQAEIRERRQLRFLDDFNLDRLLRHDNMILSHAWIARRSVLSHDVLADPGLEVGEDAYFYLLLASRHVFRFCGRVSVVWNWRSNARDNSMLAVSQQRWARCAEDIGLRLAHVSFPGGFEGRDVIGRGRVERRAFQPWQPPALARPVQQTGPKSWLKRALRMTSGGRAFLTAADQPPGDPGDIAFSIDFTQPAMPGFIVSARGLSTWESWGRWTDGPLLELEFSTPLPQRLRCVLIGHAAPGLQGQPVRVAVGEAGQPLRLSARWRACRYAIDLSNETRSRRLRLELPAVHVPALHDGRSSDTRRLGIALVRLDILER